MGARPAVLAAALLGASAFLALLAHDDASQFRNTLAALAMVAGVVGLVVLTRDPVTQDARQRRLLIATALVAVGSWVLALLPVREARSAVVLGSLGLLCTVAFVALPLWLLARRAPRTVVVAGAAGAVAASAWAFSLVGPMLRATGGAHEDLASQLAFAQQVAGWAGLLGATAYAGVVAYDLWRGAPAGAGGRSRKPPRLVVASNIVQWTPEQKARRLEELERRFQAGEIAEHDYWDKRQEIESK